MYFIPTFEKDQQLHFLLTHIYCHSFHCRRAQKYIFVHSSKLGNLVLSCMVQKEAKGSKGGKTQGPFVSHSTGWEMGP